MMKTFRVGFHYDLNGTMTVRAKNEEDAREKVEKILEEEGVEDEATADINHREYGAVNAIDVSDIFPYKKEK